MYQVVHPFGTRRIHRVEPNTADGDAPLGRTVCEIRIDRSDDVRGARPPAWAKWPDCKACSDGRALVQGDKYERRDGTVPWATHLAAWQNYDEGHFGQDAERIDERGGFGYRELQCALAGHYLRLLRSGCDEDHPVPFGWRPR